MEQFSIAPKWDLDMDEFVDGVMDIGVVSTGSLVTAGLPDLAFRREVDANNLLKIANGHMDEHGKFIKPKGHPAPDLKGLLARIIRAQDAAD
jgi:predicted HAD superfamily Cof-like phosphohydrolase